MAVKYKIYPQVIAKIENWPVYKLSKDRKNFVAEIDDFTLDKLCKIYAGKLDDIIAQTIYQERIRIKEEQWKVDPPNERVFWNKIKKKLLLSESSATKEEELVIQKEILRTIIHRYSEEIVGTFSKRVFLFARKFLYVFFSRLLNTAAVKNIQRLWSSQHQVYERLKVYGDMDIVRELMKKGTVVVVPTHFSNLDSILVGYAMDTIVGLPSFSYGAGLNLYNSGLPAFFMNRLGAYRVDRRKKNPIYLETLKSMSNVSIQRGTNSLFFPGGTRARSGALETKLKMGLLGTVVEAQRINSQNNRDKIFIVPLIIGYHFVLEARFLIDQHLKITGKEKYIGSEGGFSKRKFLSYIWKIFSKNSDIVLSFGKPLDVVGNFVDQNGDSFDKFGNKLMIDDYFKKDDLMSEDLQRETEYTKLLSDKIVERFFKENIVLSSHIVAFVGFQMLSKFYRKLDIYELMRLPTEDFNIPKEHFIAVVEQVQNLLLAMESQGELEMSLEAKLDPESLLADGLQHLGVFHIQKPLFQNEKGDLQSKDFHLLYYYHNRLTNYGIEKKLNFKTTALEILND
jgi:glycerol-3-phosphate O-acyltransferase